MKYLKLAWKVIWLVQIVPLLWVTGFLIGIANLENPIKTANYIVRTT